MFRTSGDRDLSRWLAGNSIVALAVAIFAIAVAMGPSNTPRAYAACSSAPRTAYPISSQFDGAFVS